MPKDFRACFSPTSVSTLRVLTRVRAGARSGQSIWPHKTACVTCPSAFRQCRLDKVCAATLGRSIFFRFLHRMAFLTCPCACRLRKLSQNLRLTSGARPFCCEFLHEMALLRCPSAFDCTGSRNMWIAVLGSVCSPAFSL